MGGDKLGRDGYPWVAGFWAKESGYGIWKKEVRLVEMREGGIRDSLRKDSCVHSFFLMHLDL
jgi:hypothetical protein